MPDQTNERVQHEVEDSDVRGPWPEEEDTTPAKGSYFKEHPGARTGLIVAVLVIAVAAVFIWRYYAVRESTDDAQVDGHITPISARVSGTVTAVNFQDNQQVKAGDVLVQLDPRDYEVAVARAKADLADTQATANAAQTSIPISNISTAGELASAVAQRTAAQREVDAAHARVREAQANWDKVVKDLERAKSLVSKDEISHQQYDTAYASEAAARATLDAARAAVATAESHVAQAEAAVKTAQTAPEQVAVTKSKFGSATALAQRASAALDMAMLNLQYTTVKAPANGVVSKRSVEVGQVVQAGQPLASLVDLDNIYITANFKETQLKNMRVGQPVKVQVDAFDRELNGHIDSFGGATGARFSLLPPENATGNYVKVVQRIPVKIVVEKGEDPNHILRPGLSVVPTVYTGK